jgi:peptide/nickel transport system permease protein
MGRGTPSARLLIGIVLVVILGAAALLAPWIGPGDPRETDIAARLKPPGFPGHPLGTDQLGRDLLSRILYGTRLSLLTGLATVAITIAVGTWSGVLAGYYGGRLDRVVSGVVDIQMAFPFLLMAVAIVSAIGPGLVNVVVALALWGWVIYCRLVRARVLSLKEQEFVQAVRAMGAGDARIIGRHLLPNVVPALLVISSFQVAQMVVAESAMSFLGLGVQPPTPTLGGIISDGRAYVSTAWWVTTCPGLMLMAFVLGIGFIGDWLRERLDPRMRL